MWDQSFSIKVWDLLNQVAVDEIVFENKKTKMIPNLTENWMSWKIRLSWIDEENVLVEIEDLFLELEEVCDFCTKNFVRKVEIHEYSARYTLNKDENEYANDESLFFIDEKNATINIEELLYQAIKLETPFVIYCSECAKNHENLSEEDYDIEKYEWPEETSGNIVFHK